MLYKSLAALALVGSADAFALTGLRQGSTAARSVQISMEELVDAVVKPNWG